MMPVSANSPDAQAILAELRDIHSPAAISMGPETTAWYIVFAIALMIMVWMLIRFIKAYARKRRQKQALDILHSAVTNYTAENSASAIASISILLRRIALARFKRENVASLKNAAWLNFLDQQLQTTEFSTGIGKILITAPYQKRVETDIAALSDLVERWIKRVL